MSVYERIIAAAKLRKGLRLSADDVFSLARDHAISSRAEQDGLDEAEHMECFAPEGSSGPNDCDGDGWYRCRECSRWNTHDRR